MMSQSVPRRTRGRGLHANVGLAMRRGGNPGLAESMMVCWLHARNVGHTKDWFQEMCVPYGFLDLTCLLGKIEINLVNLKLTR